MDPRKLDVRTVHRYLDKGVIDRATYDQFLADLPDLAPEVQFVDYETQFLEEQKPEAPPAPEAPASPEAPPAPPVLAPHGYPPATAAPLPATPLSATPPSMAPAPSSDPDDDSSS